jgi:phosphoesterase RecJ-like protein
MSDLAFGAAVERIQRADKVVIICHSSPDADAYGSMCGLGLGLEQLGKDVVFVNEQGSLVRYAAIPGVTRVVSQPPKAEEGRLVIVCDCAAEQRVGDTLVGWLMSQPERINIDHHYSNTLFGTTNVVVESASSTCEIIFSLLRALEDRSSGTAFTPEVSSALLSGIAADTGNFRFESVTAQTFATAGELVRRGARPAWVAQNTFPRPSLGIVKMQAEAMSNLALLCEGRYARVIVTTEMLNRFGADVSDTDPLVERARDISGVLASALLKQDGEIWRVSLRSQGSHIDVSSVAAQFGGGGHRPAAAFRWRRGIDELLGELDQKMEALVRAA